MFTPDKHLYIAHSANGPINIAGKMANRHGLIAGATGTGKTVSLQVIAESFLQAGVPCFMADMKGDLSGISQPGSLSGFINKRCTEFGIDTEALSFNGCPTCFFDVYGERGIPIRTRIDQMDSQILARLLGLNEVQTGVLAIAYKIAGEEKMDLVDIKDLRALLDYISKNSRQYTTTYGNISSASVGAIQRALLTIEDQGGNQFFGEPSFDVADFLRTIDGRGVANVLAADKLMLKPKLYSTFLLWLLTEIYEKSPEVGDCELPKFVFFFDEAHTLFKDTAPALVEKIEQIVRLIRSKGVGVYFITQSPSDIPDSVLGQLGNRVQHALRAFTPKDQAAVRSAAKTFRQNPTFSTETVITELGTGEALVSVLDENGTPTMVERAKMLFPLSQIGAITDEQRTAIITASPLNAKYATPVDPRSAAEILADRTAPAAPSSNSAETSATDSDSTRDNSKKSRNDSNSSNAESGDSDSSRDDSKKSRNGSDSQKSSRKESSAFGKIWDALKKVFLILVGTFVRKIANNAANSVNGTTRKSSSKKTTSSKSSSRKSSSKK